MPDPRTQAETLRLLKGDLARERKLRRIRRTVTRRAIADRRRRAREAAAALPTDERAILQPDWEARAATILAVKRGRRRSSFLAELGPAPVCAPGDHQSARAYLLRVVSLIERGGWSASECAGLHVLAKRWRRRASGQDARFNLVGNRTGRLPRTLEARLKEGTAHVGSQPD